MWVCLIIYISVYICIYIGVASRTSSKLLAAFL